MPIDDGVPGPVEPAAVGVGQTSSAIVQAVEVSADDPSDAAEDEDDLEEELAELEAEVADLKGLLSEAQADLKEAEETHDEQVEVYQKAAKQIIKLTQDLDGEKRVCSNLRDDIKSMKSDEALFYFVAHCIIIVVLAIISLIVFGLGTTAYYANYGVGWRTSMYGAGGLVILALYCLDRHKSHTEPHT